jgi:hypothetical protein
MLQDVTTAALTANQSRIAQLWPGGLGNGGMGMRDLVGVQDFCRIVGWPVADDTQDKAPVYPTHRWHPQRTPTIPTPMRLSAPQSPRLLSRSGELTTFWSSPA